MNFIVLLKNSFCSETCILEHEKSTSKIRETEMKDIKIIQSNDMVK